MVVYSRIILWKGVEKHMPSTITLCIENPIRTPIDDWMDHNNRVSVGRRVDDDHFEILAYSDNEDDWPELGRMAKREHALHIKSFNSAGVTFID